MANPTISVVRSPSGNVTPGAQVTFTVTAADADARAVSYTFTATDQAGNAAQVTESVVVSDPVAIGGAVSDPSGSANLSQDPGDARVWRSTV